MSSPRRKTPPLSPPISGDNDYFPGKPRKAVPHKFVLDALDELSPRTRPMFGCLAIYVDEKIVLVLRDKHEQVDDNGVWIATTADHHPSLREDFPDMRSIQVLGKGVTGWQVLPASAPDFEEVALRACEFIIARDPRIGKVPGERRTSRPKARKNPGGSRQKTSRKSAKKVR